MVLIFLRSIPFSGPYFLSNESNRTRSLEFNPKNETGLSQHANIDMSLRGHRGRWAGTTPALFRIASESPCLMLPVYHTCLFLPGRCKYSFWDFYSDKPFSSSLSSNPGSRTYVWGYSYLAFCNPSLLISEFW
jgi:hypothetical protein